MAIQWPAPGAEYVNDDTSRSWMLPNGEYLGEGGIAGGGTGGGAGGQQPVMIIVT